MNLLTILFLVPILSASILLLSFCLIFGILKFYVQLSKKKQRLRSGDGITVGFFHPYCNAGGGGERVLWCAVRALQYKYPNSRCIIYTGDCDATSEAILTHAEEKFNIVLPKKVEFIFLKKRSWVEASFYPYLTLLGQSLGSMILAYEAINSFIPDIFIDTMGYPFSYFIFKTLANCKLGCYVHYPTISTDMLSVVSDRTGSFNNRAVIANSVILTKLKLVYYWLFAWCYGSAGARADVVMVNSSWTKGHIEALWGANNEKPILKIFPPCDIKTFLSNTLDHRSHAEDIKTILSISQFRPEKNHALQVQSFARFLSAIPENERPLYRLIMAGGCRNEEDQNRVNQLTSLAQQLGVAKNVQIKVNISFHELTSLLSTAHIGIHTMTNEHFGIGVVEFQAAGVIALAHNSGGPKMDIVIGDGNAKTGFLADTAEEYAQLIKTIFNLTQAERISVAKMARQACERFSEAKFESDFLHAVKNLF